MSRKNLLIFLVFSLLLMLAACAGSGAKKLRRTCAECHPEYLEKFSRGKVHQPLREHNCESCHRLHGIIGAVLLRTEEPELCFQCHRELLPLLSSPESLHSPFRQGKCSGCHDPHASGHPSLLLQAEDQVCFTCHSPAMLEGKVVHPPVAAGCRTCHPAHAAAAPGLRFRAAEELCGGCHQLQSQVFFDAHGGFVVGGACLQCHDVHSSDRDFLLRQSSHPPVVQQKCQSCHLPPAQGSFAPLSEGESLCFGCHSRERFNRAAPHPEGSAGDCLRCHAAHASDHPRILRTPAGDLCRSCHPSPAAPAGVVHSPVKQGECLACHRQHGPDAGEHLLIRPPEELCRTCHAETYVPRAVAHPPAREGECLGCHRSHDSAVPGLLTQEQGGLCLGCHPAIENQKGRLSLHRPFGNGKCSACHDPHGGKEPHLVSAGAPQGCASCHQLESARRQPGAHPPFREGRCNLCHLSHSSDQPALLSRQIDLLCLSCHSSLKPAAGAPAAHFNCAICHVAHGNEGDSHLRQSLPGLCLSCHEGVGASWDQGVGHAPAQEGECVACHDPHFAEAERMPGRAWEGGICARCHDLDPQLLRTTHGGIAPGPRSCQSCHDPHGGADRSLTHPIKHHPFAAGECTSCHQGGSK